jgi:molybdopterin-guanine dinucleotide biosynthesis protein A
VVCCALSLPLTDPVAVRLIAGADAAGQGAVVPEVGGRLEPLLARWEPSALKALTRLPADTPLEEAAAAVGLVRVPFPAGDPGFTRVCAPEDLLHARALLDARRTTA